MGYQRCVAKGLFEGVLSSNLKSRLSHGILLRSAA